MSNKPFYQQLTQQINKTVNRKAVTTDQIVAIVEKAKAVRKSKGTFGLMAFATKIPSHFFSREEIEKLKNSPQWSQFSHKMVDLFVLEGIITESQAKMAKKTL